MPSHVLVPVDDSEQSDAALEFACEEYPDARITVLNVIEPADLREAATLETGASVTGDEFQFRQEEFAEQILEDSLETVDDYDGTIETAQMTGSAPDAIVEFAEENDVDHVAIGSHGRTGASRVLLGSIAETVARRAPVPVTIVR